MSDRREIGFEPRSVTALLTAFFLLLAAPLVGPVEATLPQGQADTTSVEVRVVHVDGRALADVPVTLEIHDGRETLQTLQGRTDPDGRMVWPSVPVAPGYHARATASWSDVRYPAPTVTLAANEPARLTIEVFETTDEGRPLHLDTLHLILQMDEPGVVRVLQFMTVSNTSEAAFAGGPALEDGRRAGVVIPLPPGVSRLAAAPFPTAQEALVLADAAVRADSVLDPRPVPPSGRQVAVTYDVIAGDDGIEFSYELPYPTASVSVLLGGAAADGVDLESSDLQSRPAEQIGDQQFDLWIANALDPGTTVEFTIGRPGFRIAAEHWALIGLGVGLILAVVGAWLGKGGGARTGAERQEILQRIARLDLQHDSGEIESGEYFARRGRELERLALLEDLTGTGEDSGTSVSASRPEAT